MAESVKQAAEAVVEGVKDLAVANKPKQQQQGVSKKKEKKANAGPAQSEELSPAAPYIQERLDLYDSLKAEYLEKIAQKPHNDITVTLPDGATRIGKAWETTPGDIARGIAKSVFENNFIARVDGVLWDFERVLEGSCKLEFLNFEDDEAKMVYWHSSAHVLGECSERRWGCDLCIGPPLEEGGFYYEMRLPDAGPVFEADWKPLENIAQKAIKEKQVFERLEVTKENLLKLFEYNKYKQHIIKDKIPDGTSTTIYRNGPFIDLCRGPHIPHTGRIKTFKIMKNSASYFLGDAANDSLQRIYGISFPDKNLMAEHLKYLEEAAKRDHRKIGTEQELWFFHQLSPGSCFFMPKGMIIYNALLTYMREEYWSRGYQEVQTPNLLNADLWRQSGHWDHYKDDMFTLDIEKAHWALKPMNCPSHCLIFGHRERSYRELPIRMADFGVLHRNEASGALSGLTRVRRFQQDDAHIFCAGETVGEELTGMFDFLSAVYGKFGFTFKMKLSTRPEKFLGDVGTWDKAEARLKEALDKFLGPEGWELNPGDGAFYGPKIDITISDALRRQFQCATIQLDFQLPQRFKLEYMTAEKASDAKAVEAVDGEAAKPRDENAPKPGYERPVMIHRAIYGSLERFIGILTEHVAGRWPFWLSPRQVLIIPVAPAVNEYCEEVQKQLRGEGFHADADLSGNTMQKKIRTGQLALYNFIFVLGAQERDSGTVNIRNRDDPATQKMGELVPLKEAVEKLKSLARERRFESKML